MLKPIPDFPGYSITPDGRVWSAPRKGRRVGRWLKPSYYRGGYISMTLSRKSKHYTKGVHRLLLETFMGPCPPGMEACHNNGNPADNKLSNLRWDTLSANTLDAVRHGTHGGFKTRGERHGNAKLTETDVRGIDALWRTGLFAQTEIAKRYGIDSTTVSNIVRGKSWRHLWASARIQTT